MGEEPVKPRRRQRPVDSAVLIAALTALAYALAYAYQWGASKYFGVPAEFVDVELKGLLLFASAASLAVVALPYLQAGIGAIARAPMYPTVPILTAVLPTAITAAFMYMWGAQWRTIAWVAGAVLALIALVFVVDAHRHDAPTFAQRLRKRFETPDWIERDMKRGVEGTIGRDAYLGLIGAGLLIATAYFTGVYGARTQTRFLVPTRGPPCVVVRAHRDVLVCAAFDQARRAVLPKYRLIPAAGAEFRLTDIGPLRGPHR